MSRPLIFIWVDMNVCVKHTDLWLTRVVKTFWYSQIIASRKYGTSLHSFIKAKYVLFIFFESKNDYM